MSDSDSTTVPAKAPQTHACVCGKICPGPPNKNGTCKMGKGPCVCYFRALRERKKANRPAMQQLGMRRGSIVIKHGFYRRKLEGGEAKLAEDLHHRFRARYPDLDELADDMMLNVAIVNYVKSLRKEPLSVDKDHNIRDYASAYERRFAEFLNFLNLTRKTRIENEGNADPLAEQMKAFFTKKPPQEAKETEGPEDQNGSNVQP